MTPIELVSVVPLALVTAPVWLRVMNELSTRAVGSAVTICPHCGVPAVVESDNPKVIR